LQGARSAILHAHSRYHYWSGSGPLSIKSFPSGQALYTVEGGTFRLDDTAYLLLNADQEYTITVDFAQPVESFCLFFADGFADEVYAGITASTQWLLDNPHMSPIRPLHFYDKCYAHDDTLSPALTQLRLNFQRHCADAGWLEEMYHNIMQRLLHTHQRVLKEVATLPALRASTRDELYRRLSRLSDYIAAYYARPLTLSDMAQVACLSPNHLLRVFKQHFRQSPHQFLRAKRIEAAKRLLTQSESSITEVCYAVGFESLGSFSWRFHKEVGLSPQQYRATQRP